MMPSALPFNKLLYQAVRATSESQSEVSSVDSDWSDVRGIALQLGVSDPDDLANERFKVDRQKLENMIKGSLPANPVADEFKALFHHAFDSV